MTCYHAGFGTLSDDPDVWSRGNHDLWVTNCIMRLRYRLTFGRTAMALLPIILAYIIPVAVAVLYYPLLRLPRERRIAPWVLLMLAASSSPCLVPLSHKPLRFGATLVTMSFMVKLYTAFMQSALAVKMNFKDYAIYLTHPALIVLNRRQPEISAADNRRLIAFYGFAALITICACVLLFRMGWNSWPLVLEHCLKVSAVALGVAMTANFAAAIFRVVGGPSQDTMGNLLNAPTPAQFWRRWNRPAQQFFHEFIFRPAGGMQRPIRATLFTFAISGLVHEYVFGIASGRVQGWQMLFFMIQGIAVVLTMRLRPIGWKLPAGIIATLTLNLATAVLFFKSVNAIAPFYAPRTP